MEPPGSYRIGFFSVGEIAVRVLQKVVGVGIVVKAPDENGVRRLALEQLGQKLGRERGLSRTSKADQRHDAGAGLPKLAEHPQLAFSSRESGGRGQRMNDRWSKALKLRCCLHLRS